MKFDKLLISTFIITFLYCLFALNVASIFYMDRANNSFNYKLELSATLIIAFFIPLLVTVNRQPVSFHKLLWLSIGFVISAPIVFFAHVVISL